MTHKVLESNICIYQRDNTIYRRSDMKKYLAGITSVIATLACILANYLVRLVNKEVSMSYKAWEGIGKEIIIYIVLGLIIGYNIYVLSKNIKNNTITIIVAVIVNIVIAAIMFYWWDQVWTIVLLVGSYLALLLTKIIEKEA